MQIDIVVLIAGVLGTLAGAIAFLFRQLVITKNKRINEVLDERDYWRGIVLKEHGVADYDAWYQEQHPMPKAGRETYLKQEKE